MRITDEFRKSMNWLHTWTGIAVSGVLFVVFWMGTLTVFHLEINKWMQPEIRDIVSIDGPMDPVVIPLINEAEFGPQEQVFFSRPSARTPLIRYRRFGGEERTNTYLHPATGEEVTLTDTLGASGFFYPFHYSLHMRWIGIGYWIVGLASIAMLVLTVSGVFIHRKIFQDFFSFRPQKNLRRSTLDLHNMTALIALPSHILFPLSGILIFGLVYVPDALSVPFGGDRASYTEARVGYYVPEPEGRPGVKPQSLDAFIERAEAVWMDRDGRRARADFVRVINAGDSSSTVMVHHSFAPRRVARATGNISFDTATGILKKDFQPGNGRLASSWLEGAHFMRYDNWLVRWLFFFAGLSGCAMIGTGMLFWMRTRIRRGFEPLSVRVIRALTVGIVLGTIASSGAFLVANRLLPADARAAGLDRAGLEVAAFFTVWIGTFLHAGLRDKAAWKDQCMLISGVALLAPMLNWLTTDTFLTSEMFGGSAAVAGTDFILLATAAASAFAAHRLSSPERTAKRNTATVLASEELH
ncbi:MAG: PepSY-associated TM helix domain-containing protein [Pseudomonadota bacterium]